MSNILFLYTKRIKQIAAMELLDPIFRWACCSLVDPNLSFFFLGFLEAAESVEVGGFRLWAGGRFKVKVCLLLGAVTALAVCALTVGAFARSSASAVSRHDER